MPEGNGVRTGCLGSPVGPFTSLRGDMTLTPDTATDEVPFWDPATRRSTDVSAASGPSGSVHLRARGRSWTAPRRRAHA